MDSNLQIYLKEINKVPLLKAEEEKALARRIAKGDRDARENMIRANLRLVVNIAKKYINRGLSFMDLIEEGNLGLLKAVEGFDPGEGCRFSTYASWWIKQAVRRALINKVKTIRIPAYMVEMIAKFKSTSADFSDEFGREPTLDEIAIQMHLPREKIALVKRAVRIFTEPSQENDADVAWSLSEMLEDHNAKKPEQGIFDSFERQKIENLLRAIDRREAEILRLRYGLADGESKTLKEIGETFGLTRERVRQIENEALRKLNTILTDAEKTSNELSQ